MKKILRSNFLKRMSNLDKIESILKYITNAQNLFGVISCIWFIWSWDFMFIKLASTNLLLSFLVSYLKGFVKAAKDDYEKNYTIID